MIDWINEKLYRVKAMWRIIMLINYMRQTVLKPDGMKQSKYIMRAVDRIKAKFPSNSLPARMFENDLPEIREVLYKY